MRHIMLFSLLCLLPLLLAADTSSPADMPVEAAASGAPFSIEEIYSAPYPMGLGPRTVAISDDARYVACGWNNEALPCRNLWLLDRQSGVWSQITDFWPEHEARKRREFERSLAKERKEWDEQQEEKKEKKKAEESGDDSSGEEEKLDDDEELLDDEKLDDDEDEKEDEGRDQQEAGGEKADTDDSKVEPKEDEFDEKKKREDFEEEIEKDYRSFGGIGEALWREGTHELLYTFEGAVWSLDMDSAAPEPRLRLRHEQGFSSLSRVEGTSALLLISDADVSMWWPQEGRLRQLTLGGYTDLDNAAGYGVSHGGRWLAACSRDYRSARKSSLWSALGDDPYVTQHYHVRPGDTQETARLKLYDLSEREPWVIEVELDDEPSYHVQQIEWSPLPGDERLLLSIVSGDTEHHRTYLITPLADVKPGEDEYKAELLYHEHDEAWINWGFTQSRWASDGSIILNSEHSGWSGLYRLEPKPETTAAADEECEEDEGSEADDAAGHGKEKDEDAKEDSGSHMAVPLYVKEHEVTDFMPLRNSPWVVMELALPDPSCRSLAAVNVHSGAMIELAGGADWRSGLTLSDDESLLSYMLTTLRQPGNLVAIDLAAALAGSAPQEQTLLDRRRPEWLEWTASWDVRVLKIPGEGGDIWCKLYLPEGWDPAKQYPLMVWSHGAGYAQTVKQDAGHWELFHPWLASEKGWMAVEIDWRHSSGYGRDWRVAVQDQLGTPEVADVLSVVHELEANYGADPARTAMWGWSYGGFMTLMALGLAPGEFEVGCAVAPAIDWRNYFYWYSTCRLDSPADNEKAYEKSDATTYLENITDRLLILHGMRDDNTLFQSVVQYIEEGHEQGVNVDLKLYPEGGHGIGRDFHYIALYKAMTEYCEQHWE